CARKNYYGSSCWFAYW
nr:immunoglobulin heavy chain junction region [Mus musculus]MBK4198639.1 immunoglobulin heavy chain junction region [Mus musculus]MBK4198640.1 immunoglobulin heavy chain junction region [Mus musculus]MBK4198641.1 immunoglobulin heavy chain junction region [Mus musculus]MBK4198642.1 immunoglobulin heavy chain junction region [Mus musculus]